MLAMKGLSTMLPRGGGQGCELLHALLTPIAHMVATQTRAAAQVMERRLREDSGGEMERAVTGMYSGKRGLRTQDAARAEGLASESLQRRLEGLDRLMQAQWGVRGCPPLH